MTTDAAPTPSVDLPPAEGDVTPADGDGRDQAAAPAVGNRHGPAPEVERGADPEPSSDGDRPDADPELERPRADRFVRRALRVEGPPVPGAVFGAQGFMSRSIAVSAVRCTITYLLVPILTPIVGVLNVVDAPLSIALITLAFVMSVRSLRRFWLADHAKRWAYTALILVVWLLLAAALGTDIARLV